MEKFRDIGLASLTQYSAAHDDPNAKISDRLFKLIDYAKDRFHWYEDQREKKLSLALSMLTLSGVAMTITMNSLVGNGIDQNSLQFRLVSILLILLILTSTSVIAVYLKGQNLKYTHRSDLNNIYSWYGYGVPSVKQVGIFEFIIWGRFSSLTLTDENDPCLKSKKREIADGYKIFTQEVTPRLFDTYLAAEEDLQQIYVLQIFQNISRENLRYMVSCLKVGGIAIAVVTLYLGLILLFHGIPTVKQ